MPLSTRPRLVLVTAAAAALTLTSCTSREETPAAPSSGGGPAASAQSAAPSADGCTLDKTGYPKVDLKTAVVGFSQSEKEANPFRIAETQSIATRPPSSASRATTCSPPTPRAT